MQTMQSCVSGTSPGVVVVVVVVVSEGGVDADEDASGVDDDSGDGDDEAVALAVDGGAEALAEVAVVMEEGSLASQLLMSGTGAPATLADIRNTT